MAESTPNQRTENIGFLSPGVSIADVEDSNRPRQVMGFRDLVLFTPQHRHAVAIEPYTCSADAANFWSRGIDSGWLVLDPGGEWEGAVEYRFEPVGS